MNIHKYIIYYQFNQYFSRCLLTCIYIYVLGYIAYPRNSQGVAHRRCLPQSVSAIPDLRSSLDNGSSFSGISRVYLLHQCCFVLFLFRTILIFSFSHVCCLVSNHLVCHFSVFVDSKKMYIL